MNVFNAACFYVSCCLRRFSVPSVTICISLRSIILLSFNFSFPHRDQLKIPVLALVDSDPYGLKILSVYSSGSKQMSYDSSHLTTSDIKWLGVTYFYSFSFSS